MLHVFVCVSSCCVNIFSFSSDDIARAIKKLKLLGNGFAIIPVGKHRLVQSVPGELNLDHSIVLQKAEKTSHVSVATMVNDYGWTEVRAKKVLVSICVIVLVQTLGT